MADLIATAAMCTFLASHRTVFKKTKQLIRSLIFYSVNRGVMVALCQIISLVLFTVSNIAMWWTPFHLCLSKLHVITLLALLNSRTPSAPQQEEHNLSSIAFSHTAVSSSRGNVNSKNKSNSSRLGFGICHNIEQAGVSSYPSVYTFTPTLSQSNVQSKKSLANAEESDEGGMDRKLAL